MLKIMEQLKLDYQAEGGAEPTLYSCVYTRVLTRVQLTSGREPSSNTPMMCVESIRVWVHTGG